MAASSSSHRDVILSPLGMQRETVSTWTTKDVFSEEKRLVGCLEALLTFKYLPSL